MQRNFELSKVYDSNIGKVILKQFYVYIVVKEKSAKLCLNWKRLRKQAKNYFLVFSLERA